MVLKSAQSHSSRRSCFGIQPIRYFLDHGADFITGYPFAEAFAERIRTMLGPWRECKEKYPHLAPQLQEQADRALRYFCFKDDLKWMSL